MAECCIVGCSNKSAKRGEIKFYTLPTAKSSRPNKVKRRQLWLEAIEKANGSTAGLKEDAQICSAHFVSGQMSLEVSDQDFVPSVFPKPPEKTRRDTLRPRSAAITEAAKVTPQKTAGRKRAKTPDQVLQFNNIVFPENNYCEPLEDEEFLEEEEEDATQLSSTLVTTKPSQVSPSQVSPVHIATEATQLCTYQEAKETTQLSPKQVTTELPFEEPPEYPQLKKPKLELKSVVAGLGLFRCEMCNGKFSSGKMLVKHKRLHDQEWSDDESWPSLSEKVSEETDIMDVPVPVEELPFKCNMCDRSFPTTHSLKRHKLLHVRDPRKCRLCGTMFCKRHNHVVAQPQISTETNFEDYTTKDNIMDVSVENQLPETTSCANDDVDKSLGLLLNTDTHTLDAITTAQNHSLEDVEPKSVPKITISPQRTGILTAFKSFLTKHKVPNIKAEQVEPSSICISSTSSPTQNFESTQVASKSAGNIRTPAVPTHCATTATSLIVMNPTATQPVAEPSRKPVPFGTSANILTPQPVLLMTKPSQPQPGQPNPQSTVCLTFSNPLPSNVVNEFMSIITRSDYGKSPGPQLLTFSSKPENAAPKQDPPSNPIASIIKLEPATVPIQAPHMSKKTTVYSKEEKTTFIITSQPAPHQNMLPSSVKAPLFVSSSSSSIISPGKPKPRAKKTDKNKPPLHLEDSWKKYIHGSLPPSPEPIFAKIQRGPWDSPFQNYTKDFLQPHLSQKPALPPSLQMFSPQLLTSAFLDVKRNYDYILSK